LNRFSDDFGEGGFKKLISGGTYFPNTYYNYVPTATGPGHASIYSGCNPSNHGIVGNRWLNREDARINYCVSDENAVGVASTTAIGQRSPLNLKGASIGDMLKLSNSGKSLVYSLAIKDRSAILPGGHSADVVYWWDESTTKWTTSDYYMKELPKWLIELEIENPVYNYMFTWSPIEGTKSDPGLKEHNSFEEAFKGSDNTGFPHDLQALADVEGYGVLKYSPFGNSYTFDMAKSMLRNSDLGRDYIPDFFSISFSSTDYIGHRFGPYSEEIRDTYIRFDRDLAEFISFLESEYGGDFLLFLTSDHGVMPNTEFLNSKKIPSQRFDYNALKLQLKKQLSEKYGSEKIFQALVENQVYLNKGELARLHLEEKAVERFLAEFLQENPLISVVLTSHDLMRQNYTRFPHVLIQNGFQKERSGNLVFVLESFADDAEYTKGASHGSPYDYDRHVPLIFYGRGITKGKCYYGNVDITQIAPSIADLLNIGRPPFCTAPSLTEIITSP
jgi:predicted AlkP superfamily pyrophosphatase or phosphodiesterase